MDISPDGQILASTSIVADSGPPSVDFSIRLWDIHTGKQLRSLLGHTDYVLQVAFSPDGRTLASCGLDRTIKIWDVASGQELRTLAGHSDTVTCIAFSPDGKKLVSGSNDRSIRLWEAASGRLICAKIFKVRASGRDFEPLCVVFSPDSDAIACGAHDRTLRIFVGEQLRQTAVIQNTSAIRSVTYSPDGKEVVSGSFGGSINIYDVSSLQLIRKISIGEFNVVLGLAFIRNGEILAAYDQHHYAYLWVASTGRLLNNMVGPKNVEVATMAFTADSKTLVSGCDDGTIKLWDVLSGKLLRTILNIAVGAPAGASSGLILAHRSDSVSPVLCVAFSPDGKLLATAAGGRQRDFAPNVRNNVIKIWDVDAKKELRTLDFQQTAITTVAFSRDGQKVAGGCSDGSATVWEVSSGKEVQQIPHAINYYFGVVFAAFSPNGNDLLIGGRNNVSLWDLASGKKVRTVNDGEQSFEGGLSADGTTLALFDNDYKIRLCDVGSGNLRATIDTGYSSFDTIHTVSLSPSGKLLAISNEKGETIIFDVATCTKLHEFNGNGIPLESVAFNPSETILASSSEDQTIRFWDVSSGKMLRVLAALSDTPSSIAFSPDGTTLAAGCRDGTVEVWPVSP